MTHRMHADPAVPVRGTAPALRRIPGALLLDFGGVIITTSKRVEGRAQFAKILQNRLSAGGVELTAARLEACLEAGAAALKHWKHASSRRRQPRELTVEEILGEFYFGDLPDPARALLTGDGAELLDQMSTALTDHTIRAGARELIHYAQEQGIALGIVSNAHSGRSHRRILSELGLNGAFGVQIYSDEAGIRKPHPSMLTRAVEALGVEASDCWYVGDTLDRDVVAGRRAGIGAVVLTRSQHTAEPPFLIHDVADATVEDPAALLRILQDAVAAPDGGTTPALAQRSYQPAAAQPAVMKNQAILLDHGGVISHTGKPQYQFAEGAAAVETVLERAGCGIEPGAGLAIIRTAHENYKQYKAEHDDDAWGSGLDYREITARQYWGEFTGELISKRQRQALLAEATQLQLALYRSKSTKAERPGIRRFLEDCRAHRRPVIIVSNTICGAGVRGIVRSYGFDHLVTGWVCSDEFGRKKPHRDIFDFALRMAGVAPEHAVMVGDKPFNDAFGAQGAGITRRIITRGGSGTDAEIDSALARGWVTDVVDDPGLIPALLS
ncbi:HAD family hydrolase [Nesterenkonia haasae]|uniref:HAD family hydrolase n=1 Tax=Nesterenkonia haasae TaxID=2587813 RepID=UPI001391B389|nr:HAD family hydrolase [Nesterenkonia haasae]NDK32886.1 HAD family hydrolase [Nesterenkonia haasae]